MAVKALELQCVSLVQQTLKVKTFQTQQKQENSSSVTLASNNAVLSDLNDSKFFFLVRGMLGSTAHKIIDNGLAACMYELVVHCREEYCKFIEERIIEISLNAQRRLVLANAGEEDDDDDDDDDMDQLSLDAFSDNSLFFEDVAYLDASDGDSDSDEDFTVDAQQIRAPLGPNAPGALANAVGLVGASNSNGEEEEEDSDDEVYITSLKYNSATNEPRTALRLPREEWKQYMNDRLPQVQKALRQLSKLHVTIVPIKEQQETLYAIEILGHY